MADDRCGVNGPRARGSGHYYLVMEGSRNTEMGPDGNGLSSACLAWTGQPDAESEGYQGPRRSTRSCLTRTHK